MTLYVAVSFGFDLEVISFPFFVFTIVGDLVIPKKSISGVLYLLVAKELDLPV